MVTVCIASFDWWTSKEGIASVMCCSVQLESMNVFICFERNNLLLGGQTALDLQMIPDGPRL